MSHRIRGEGLEIDFKDIGMLTEGRVRRYVRNMGAWRAVLTLLVAGFMGVVGLLGAVKGTWLNPLMLVWPIAAAMWVFREILVKFPTASQRGLQVLWVLIVVAAVGLRAKAAPDWLSWAVCAMTGFYVGGSFWLLSDRRIFAER